MSGQCASLFQPTRMQLFLTGGEWLGPTGRYGRDSREGRHAPAGPVHPVKYSETLATN